MDVTATTLDLDWPTTDQTVMSPPPVSVPTIGSTFGVDAARTRKSDPITSHRAGDKSAETLTLVQAAVLDLIRRAGRLTGSQINTHYRSGAPIIGWPMVAWDSPRKRAGELAAAGALVIVNEDAPRGTEREYALPAETKEKAA